MISLLYLIKPFQLVGATNKLLCFLVILASVVSSSASAQTPQPVAAAPPQIPHYRHIDTTVKSPPLPEIKTLTLLTDADFPPFSFQNPQGGISGLSVDLALAACDILQVKCQLVAKPFAELVAALEAGEGDVIISPLKLDPNLLTYARMTRPYLWSQARFVVPAANGLSNSDAKSLAGLRIGAVTGSAHAAWLKSYYNGSTLSDFASASELYAALKSGQVDAIFGDNLQLTFWLAGTSSAQCCRVLGEAYTDRDYFSRNIVFLLSPKQEALIPSLDYALDELQRNGSTSALLARYLPLQFF